jgi:tetratricopeptide (TPR) repeat protein
MAIWTTEIKEIERLYESFKGQLPDLEKELEQLIRTEDANVIMLYSRRCLEVIITDLCECELKRPRKTEPLKGIIDKLHKEGKVPSHIITSMHGLNELSTYGTHPKDFDPEQVKPALSNLTIIIRWYLKYKNSQAISKAEPEQEKYSVKQTEIPAEVIHKPKKNLILILISILLIISVIVFPKIFKRDKLANLRSSDGRISVAVMPFQNMTNDTTWNIWQDGIQEHLTNSLSNSEELKVRQTESIKSVIQSKGLTNYASINPSFASTISQKLDASVFVYGNITQAGTKIRVSGQLIDSKTEEVFKSFQIEEYDEEENIFQVIDSLSAQVKNFLLISKLEKETRSDYQLFASTNSPEAYRYFMYGNNDFFKADFPAAADWFSKAVKTDSNFVMALARLSYSYGNQGLYEEAKKWCLKAYGKKNLMSIQQQLFVDLLYATYFETNEEEIKVAKRMLDIDDQLPIIYYRVALSYICLHQYDRAIPELEKVFDIYKKWGLRQPWVYGYTYLGLAYHKTGQFKNEKKLYKIAEQDFPDSPALINRQIVLALTEGEINKVTQYIEKVTSILKDNSANEAYIIAILGSAYSEADFLDKAEEYYRKALSLEPENPEMLYNLAFFLIDKDRNINEGLELVGKALVLSPENYEYLDKKGWGLYKQGHFKEALDILQKSWELKPIYDHDLFLHLEAAKKAVAGQKNN